MPKRRHRRRGNNPIWIVPAILIAIIALGVGGVYTYKSFGLFNQNRQQRIESSQQESSRQAELDAMLQILDQDVFHAGIFIDDFDLSGKTYAEAESELKKREEAFRSDFLITLTLGSQKWQIAADDELYKSDWRDLLDQAWGIGRTSSQNEKDARIRELYAAVQELQASPRHLAVSRTFSESLISARILAIAGEQTIAAVDAKATGFDLETKKFIIAAHQDGISVDGAACVEEVLAQLKAGKTQISATFKSAPVLSAMTAENLVSHLGLVSEGVTYAREVNVNRDSNIRLICKMINGLVLQPGETFSFNGFIGERTAAKGFMPAGGISNGILVQELGGGICQPNTTLCQAVLKADLEIVERNSHSWPSDYVPVGLDSTVSWPGPDFKFKNDSGYPIAIVCWYDKPAVVFQIYGRLLDEGVSISLESEITSTTPVTAPPVETLNEALQPGERVVIRAAHSGKQATAYKIWKKNGEVIKREAVFTSTYKPLNAIYEYGPPLPSPAPTPVATPAAPPA